MFGRPSARSEFHAESRFGAADQPLSLGPRHPCGGERDPDMPVAQDQNQGASPGAFYVVQLSDMGTIW
jgi:hypothetical protein